MDNLNNYISVCDPSYSKKFYPDEYNSDSEHSKEIIIYQLQPHSLDSTATIMKVGIMKNISDILIKNFNILNKYKCYMISKIYSQEQLEIIRYDGKFQLIKIIICFNQNDFVPIAHLCFNFDTNQLQNDNKLADYLSDENKKININGTYSITLHFQENGNNKFIMLEQDTHFCGQTEMMVKLTEWLFDDKIQNIINNLNN